MLSLQDKANEIKQRLKETEKQLEKTRHSNNPYKGYLIDQYEEQLRRLHMELQPYVDMLEMVRNEEKWLEKKRRYDGKDKRD